MNNKILKKGMKIHVTGACGVAIGQIAVLLQEDKDLNVTISGSDRAIYPPTSEFLRRHKFELKLGFKKEHVPDDVDLIIANAFITEDNPEIKHARERNIPVVGFAEIVNELLIKKESIVVIGNKGKTTVTAMIANLLKEAGKDPSYLIGGYPKFVKDPGYEDRSQSGVKRGSLEWSVVEGDEYPVLSWKKVPKFSLYSTKYLVITGVKWDHMSIYQTKESYLRVFEDACKRIPKDGVIIYCEKDCQDIKSTLERVSAALCPYSERLADVDALKSEPRGIWRENAGAVIALGEALQISKDIIFKSFGFVKGVQRREEIRYETTKSKVMVFDDFAHSPTKVRGCISSLKNQYPSRKLIVVYEPGDRSEYSLNDPDYLSCFEGAARVILPHVTTADPSKKDYGRKLADHIAKGFEFVDYFEEDSEVIEELKKEAATLKEDETKAVVFMSQRGFRGMIERLITALESDRV